MSGNVRWENESFCDVDEQNLQKIHENGGNLTIFTHHFWALALNAVLLTNGRPERQGLALERMWNIILPVNCGQALAMQWVGLVLCRFPLHQACCIRWLWLAIQSRNRPSSVKWGWGWGDTYFQRLKGTWDYLLENALYTVRFCWETGASHSLSKSSGAKLLLS